uniref:Uncharacterized protein n=1 Tax=Pristionchus pacificus TaxID=54126 RepID=A0A8R1UF37_PRIPA
HLVAACLFLSRFRSSFFASWSSMPEMSFFTVDRFLGGADPLFFDRSSESESESSSESCIEFSDGPTLGGATELAADAAAALKNGIGGGGCSRWAAAAAAA